MEYLILGLLVTFLIMSNITIILFGIYEDFDCVEWVIIFVFVYLFPLWLIYKLFRKIRPSEPKIIIKQEDLPERIEDK